MGWPRRSRWLGFYSPIPYPFAIAQCRRRNPWQTSVTRVFRGDAARWNPAELLIAALSACHQLWYLHLCADAGIVVVAYSDDASGVEIEQADGARRLHDAAAEKCFIARSVSFRVEHDPTFEIASA